MGMAWTTPFNGVPAPRQLAKTVLSVFLCPSNSQENVRRNQAIELDNGGWNAPQADTAGGLDYVGNLGHMWSGWHDVDPLPDFPDPEVPTGVPSRFQKGQPGTPWASERWNNDNPIINGVFLYRGQRPIAAISDGSSNTVLVYESHHWRGGSLIAGAQNFYMPHDVANWASAHGALGTMRQPINTRNPNWQWVNGTDGDVRNYGPQSMHPGGTHFLFADGSVHFLNETIDNLLRYNIAVRNDGHPVPEF
jgi:prepilin-type processing-associated H-X9-DG protein